MKPHYFHPNGVPCEAPYRKEPQIKKRYALSTYLIPSDARFAFTYLLLHLRRFHPCHRYRTVPSTLRDRSLLLQTFSKIKTEQ